MRFSRTPVQHRAPPDLGANTRQVLTSALKLTAESIERLKNKAII
jgi:crotonobetainyl-CoA:carnitine CoA-transferase CaiB-like acyl-CoA transferase